MRGAGCPGHCCVAMESVTLQKCSNPAPLSLRCRKVFLSSIHENPKTKPKKNLLSTSSKFYFKQKLS